MAEGNEPAVEPSTSEETAKPQAADPQAPTTRLTPERYAAETRRLDRLLVLLVVVFAGFVASFVARNSDVWLHLATGRALVQGQYTFGVDPFSYTTGGVYWANHSWLYDLALYGLAEAAGDMDNPTARALLTAVKALLIALLAGVLIGIRRHGQSMWIPATCTALALLVMSPRLLLHPTIGSFLLLGLTLYFLTRDGKPAPETRGWRLLLTSAPARLYVLPVLFLLWVNLDGWFLLGPLTLALYILGEALERSYTRPAQADSEIRTLVIVWMLGLLACLVNPHHYRAFTVPPEALPGAFLAPLKNDATFVGLFVSPFTKGYWSNAIGENPAGYAYFVLLGVSLFSFALNLGELRLWRATVWLAFAALSVLNVRGVPFFAVAAGPITALNLQDFAARRFGVDTPASNAGRLWGLAGRFATVLGLFALLALAWPGWLQPYSTDPALARRVQWGVEVNPSLRQTAEQLCTWRKKGLVPAGSHSFNFSPEAANYCAWFCPEEKGFVDYRYALFDKHLSDYVAIRKALRREDPAAEAAWRPVFAKYNIDRIILSNMSERTLLATMFDSKEWTLLSLDGRSAAFGWRDPAAAADPLAKLRFNLSERAFGAGADRAPPEGPGRPPHRPSGWERYLDPPASRPLDADLASMLTELYYKPTAARERERTHVRYLAWLFGLPGVGAGNDPASAMTAVALRLPLAGYVVPADTLENEAAAAPVAARRAARRALAESPNSGSAYAALAKSADALWRWQENHWANLPAPGPINTAQLNQLRQVLGQRKPGQSIDAYLSPWIRNSVSPRQLLRQMELVWAWQQALALGTDRLAAHEALATTYWQMGYYDLAVEHFAEYVQLRKTSGPAPGEDGNRFTEQLRDQEKGVEQLRKALQDLRTEFELAAASLTPPERAGRALHYGLIRPALDILEKADPKQFTPREASLLVYLLMTTGQPEKLSDGRLGRLPDSMKAFPGFSFDYCQTLLAAAAGDYAFGGETLDRLLRAAKPQANLPVLATHLLQFATVEHLQKPTLAGLAFLTPEVVKPLAEIQGTIMVGLKQQQDLGELLVLRGLIALDEGDTATARRQFQMALGVGVSFESRPIAARYLKLLEEAAKR